MEIKLKSRLFEPGGVDVAENQVVSIKGRKNNNIRCLDGTVWVTWPPGKETTLQGGQSISVATTGKICIQAMSAAVVSVQICGDGVLSKLERYYETNATFGTIHPPISQGNVLSRE